MLYYKRIISMIPDLWDKPLKLLLLFASILKTEVVWFKGEENSYT